MPYEDNQCISTEERRNVLPVQSGILQTDIPDLQHSRTKLSVEADSVLAQKFLIDPVYYGHFRMTYKVCYKLALNN